jgi:hypothetical protein
MERGESGCQREQAWSSLRETACEVFFDPLVRLEDAGDEDEARDAVVGLTEDWRLLFVVHLIREDDTIRIVSKHFRNTYRLFESREGWLFLDEKATWLLYFGLHQFRKCCSAAGNGAGAESI